MLWKPADANRCRFCLIQFLDPSGDKNSRKTGGQAGVGNDRDSSGFCFRIKFVLSVNHVMVAAVIHGVAPGFNRPVREVEIERIIGGKDRTVRPFQERNDLVAVLEIHDRTSLPRHPEPGECAVYGRGISIRDMDFGSGPFQIPRSRDSLAARAEHEITRHLISFRETVPPSVMRSGSDAAHRPAGERQTLSDRRRIRHAD